MSDVACTCASPDSGWCFVHEAVPDPEAAADEEQRRAREAMDAAYEEERSAWDFIPDETQRDCPLCGRPLLCPSDHHLVPQCRGGSATLTICEDCHLCVHQLFTNKQLEDEYSTVEALMGNERFARTVAFIAKQDPARRTYTARPEDQRRRGRNG